MAKKKNDVLTGINCLRDGAYAIESYKISHIEGRLLTFIESLGLRDTQEKAAKDIAREIIWSLTSNNYGTYLFIQGEDLIELEQKYKSNWSKATGAGNVPNRI